MKLFIRTILSIWFGIGSILAIYQWIHWIGVHYRIIPDTELFGEWYYTPIFWILLLPTLISIGILAALGIILGLIIYFTFLCYFVGLLISAIYYTIFGKFKIGGTFDLWNIFEKYHF